MSDPFGRAIRDHHRGDRTAALVQRDGRQSHVHPIERFYFGEFPDTATDSEWLLAWLDGPLVDLGAGAGEHALYFQRQFETVAVEESTALVETMRERGVEDVRRGDMFALSETFVRDRFQSALAHGTQVGLAGSMCGLREFLGGLAHVTTPDGTAVVDCYDPTVPEAADLLGYRADPTAGLAHRVLTFEYEGETSEILQFRLFSPDRVRAATAGTDWRVAETTYPATGNPAYYRAALTKRSR